MASVRRSLARESFEATFTSPRSKANCDGIRESIAWFDEDPARQLIDEQANARWDALIAANELGLEAARRMR